MNKTLSALDFHAADHLDAIGALLPFCGNTSHSPEGHIQLSILEDRRLAHQEIGRLVIINGKLRIQNIQCRILAPPATANQLRELRLDRIIWMDETTRS